MSAVVRIKADVRFRPWALQRVVGVPVVLPGQIVAATTAVAEDLDVDMTRVVPVCLAEAKIYNIDDALNAAMLRQQDAANRVRLLRCLRARKQEENWDLLWRQSGNAGRILLSLPDNLQPSRQDDRY